MRQRRMTMSMGLLWWSDAISMGGGDTVKTEEEGGGEGECFMMDYDYWLHQCTLLSTSSDYTMYGTTFFPSPNMRVGVWRKKRVYAWL